MTEPAHPAALQLCIDTIHALATASPAAELAAHECLETLRRMGVDARHSAERKPGPSWADRTRPGRQPGLF